MSEVKAKKASLLTIEKELLSSYIEAITDMKRLRKVIDDGEGVWRTSSLTTIDEIIDKHIDKLKSSGIWET